MRHAGDAPRTRGTLQVDESVTRHRICIVGPYAGSMLLQRWSDKYAGGAEMQQVLLARELARRGHEVSFVIQEAEGPETREVDGITVYRYPPAHVFSGVNAGIKCQRLWRTLMKIRPEIIYQRMADWTTGVCAAAARPIGAIFIHAVASDQDVIKDEWRSGNAWQGWMYCWGLRRANLILAQHPGQLANLRDGFRLESRVFPSVYLSAPAEGAFPRDGVYWVAMTREAKRPRLFFELARRLPELRFTMIGGPDGGPQTHRYFQELVQEASALANLQLLGFQTPWEIDQELKRAVALVSTSPSGGEGLPVTYLQAWRQGVPTIGFSSPGSGKIPAECGWAVRHLDEVVELLQHTKADPGRFTARGRLAREHFQKNHAVDVVIPRFERMMDEALARRSVRGVGAGRSVGCGS